MGEPKCFICGREINRIGTRYDGNRKPFEFKCPDCERLEVLKNLRAGAVEQSNQLRAEIANSGERTAKVIADKMQAIATQQQTALNQAMTQLSSEISSAMSDVQERLDIINSTLTWGLQDILWQVREQTTVLTSINDTLKTLAQPSPLRKSSWYLNVADELSLRGVHKDAIQYYRRSMRLNPLDYRTYIGLSFSLIATNQPKRALKSLEKSLSFAPKAEIDYQSYSLRLMGRVHYSLGNTMEAKNLLERAIALSPDYQDAHHDFAQYAVELGEVDAVSKSITKLLTASTEVYYDRLQDQHLAPFRDAFHAQVLQEFETEIVTVKLQLDEAYNLYNEVMSQMSSIRDHEHRAIHIRVINQHYTTIVDIVRPLLQTSEVDEERERVWPLDAGSLPDMKNRLRSSTEYQLPSYENYLLLKEEIKKCQTARGQVGYQLGEVRQRQQLILYGISKQKQHWWQF